MKTKLFILLLPLTLVLGCKSRNNIEGGLQNKSLKEEYISQEYDATSNLQAPPPAASEANINIEKKIIKTAYVSIEVLNYLNSRKLIDSAINAFSAYVVSENLQNTESQISNSINIRVPAAQFEKLLTSLTKIAKKIDYQNIETQDVSEEFIDVRTRLSNSRKVEQTYLKLLRKTATIEDILKIEQKLGEVRTDIESTEGRLKYLNHQVSFSSINFNVYQTVEFKYIPDKLPNFFQRLFKALDMGWKGIVTFLLFLVRFWPLWLIIALAWYGWKFFIRLRKQRRKDLKRKKKMLKKEAQEQQNQPHI